MRRHLATSGSAPPARASSSLACLAFVLILAVAFWAGVLWTTQFFLRVGVY